MEQWLRFMARVAEAQHIAACAIGRLAGLDRATVERAVIKRLPPLAAADYRRDPAWRDGLSILLDAAGTDETPALARAVLESLRGCEARRVEALADNFLYGSVESADAGGTFYVAAALQVYFTRLAAALPTACLRLLPERGLCPCCGSTPVSGVVTETGETRGARYLYCSLCSTAWNHVRAMCITCKQSRSVALRVTGGDSDAITAETCDNCRTYAKMIYRVRNAEVDPFADDLATLALDIIVSDAGWSRHAPNPLLLVGSH